MAGLIGQRLGQYEILGVLGEGGMATVYRAMRQVPRSEVAVKVIKTSAFTADTLGEFLRRFEREAETIASLSHPHILKLFDYGQQGDTVYLVMELLRGGSLAALIRQGTLTLEQTCAILDQIASALDYAHEQGVVHRDMKPQNVLLDKQGNAILTDFGIAKITTVHTELTHSGVSMGTPSYMAPEQWRGLPLDGRADNYAFGIIAYEMLTGQTPFKADTPAAVMYQHLQEPPPSIGKFRKDVPPAAEKVIMRMLAKQPEQRYNSALEFAQAFRRALFGMPTGQFPQPRATRTPLVIGAGIIALALLIVAVLAFSNRQNPPTATTLQAAVNNSPTNTDVPQATISPTVPILAQLPTGTATSTLTFTPSASFTTTVDAQGTGRAAAISSATRQMDMSSTARQSTSAYETLQANVLSNLTKTVLAYTRTPTPITPTLTATSTVTPSLTITPSNTATSTVQLTKATATLIPTLTNTVEVMKATATLIPTIGGTLGTPTLSATDVFAAALTPVPTLTGNQPNGKAWVRLLHASPNVPLAKLFVNGTQVGQTIPFSATFDGGQFVSIASGNTAIAVLDGDSQALINGTYTLAPNSLTTFVLFGFKGDQGARKLRLVPLYHDTDLQQLGEKASVQFLNALVYDTDKEDPEKDWFPVDVWNADLVGERTPKTRIFSGLRYGEITSSLPVDATLQSYTVTLPGEKTNFISQPIRLQMEKQRSHLVILVGYTNREFQPRRVIQLVVASYRLNPDGSLYVRPTAVPVATNVVTTEGTPTSGANGGGGGSGGGPQPTNPPPPTLVNTPTVSFGG